MRSYIYYCDTRQEVIYCTLEVLDLCTNSSCTFCGLPTTKQLKKLIL